MARVRTVILLVTLFLASFSWCFSLTEGFAPFPGGCGGWCKSRPKRRTANRSFALCAGNRQCIRKLKRLIAQTRYKHVEMLMQKAKRSFRGRRYWQKVRQELDIQGNGVNGTTKFDRLVMTWIRRVLKTKENSSTGKKSENTFQKVVGLFKIYLSLSASEK